MSLAPLLPSTASIGNAFPDLKSCMISDLSRVFPVESVQVKLGSSKSSFCVIEELPDPKAARSVLSNSWSFSSAATDGVAKCSKVPAQTRTIASASNRFIASSLSAVPWRDSNAAPWPQSSKGFLKKHTSSFGWNGAS
jgi:hypothetical protein